MAINVDHCIVCAAEDWWYGHEKWWILKAWPALLHPTSFSFEKRMGEFQSNLPSWSATLWCPTSNVRPMSKEAREVGLGRELRCQNGGSGRISNKRVSTNRVLWWHVWHTVDGRNPAPVDRWFTPLFIGFQPSKGGAGFLPSTVCDMLISVKTDPSCDLGRVSGRAQGWQKAISDLDRFEGGGCSTLT